MRSLKFALPTLFLVGAVQAADITEEQCQEFRDWESITLNDAQKKEVEDSCKSRYSSENTLMNCTTFEGEDYRKALQERAKMECR